MAWRPFKSIFDKVTDLLMKERPKVGDSVLTDFERLCYEIRICDVLLIEGRSRVSNVISSITRSPWTHAALYIGRLHDITNEEHRAKVAKLYKGPPGDQLIIESLMGKGTIVTPLEHYKDFHIRICRPKGISRHDANAVINYAIDNLGTQYNVRQLLDLARFLFPWSILPRRWRSSLFIHNAGQPTRQVCSSLIGEAFYAVHFPILPVIKKREDKKIELYLTNPRLFTPSDFDFSPYFEIIKYPLFEFEGRSFYQELPWNTEGKFSDKEGNIYQPTIVGEKPKESSEPDEEKK